MDSEKLNDILKDESFMKEVLKSNSAEEFKDLFKSKGIDLSDEDVKEIVNVVSNEMKKPIEECDLENISGGKIEQYFNLRTLKRVSKSVLILSIAGSVIYFAKKSGEVMDATTSLLNEAERATRKAELVLDDAGNVINETGKAVGALTNVLNTTDSKIQKTSTGVLGRLFLNIL